MLQRVLIMVMTAAVLGGSGYFAATRLRGIFEHDDLAAAGAVAYAEISTASPSSVLSSPMARGITVPILVYHIVRPSYPSDNASVRTLALTPEYFDAEMKYLDTAGYHIIRFSDLEAHFKEGKILPTKPIILTFDDGWSDQYVYAFPVLKKYGYPATFFVFTNAIGRKGFMTWDELREMIRAGMVIGDHTRTHPYLTKIKTEAALWDEIYGSKQLLEQKLGISVNEFAYPFGRYNATTTAFVKKAGYASARGDFMTKKQVVDMLFELGALNAPTTTEEFIKKFP